ncbi:zinc-binding alcohol dehydrogenase family protein [Pseudonocardia sp. WMMC193]|uniref:zinc-binding alcohol dehydrogenase family protein n=1 Tax=Pseudonocardia sp. WMMC193 TaxID=2911965 RepID=UPI001F1BFB15|nr:zinc-binding alcohol dehydrogenase family protein [Pseudonocardia sp. WMMC193]MCF7552857.1 zinc-binding alcohol dehydrogenase family protein [Pseudonocardia sp. WMMC193]
MTTRTTAVDAHTFTEIDLDVPDPDPHDLLVEVRAVSVNPVDHKVRAGLTGPRVLGFDAAGVVRAVGPEVTAYAPGDEVFYAGTIDRPGSNAGLQLVDEHVVGRKPRSLDWAEAAALPLTTITAWETLFDALRLGPESTGRLLVVSAAGGVGGMVTQLAKTLTGVEVIGTASRPESAAFARSMGADHIADHHELVASVRSVAPDVQFVFSPVSGRNVEAYAELLTPRGEIVAIDEPPGMDLVPLKTKSLTWHWELMFTRPLFQPTDATQRELLNRVAELVDEGRLRTTLTQTYTGLTGDNLRKAHEQLESGRTIGKIALTL